MKHKILLSLLVLALGAGIFLSWHSIGFPRTPVPLISPLVLPEKFLRSGSVGYWWSEEGLLSLQSHINQLDIVTLYLYGLEQDGEVTLGEVVKPITETQLLSLAHQQDTEIILGINNFERPELLDGLLNDPAVLEKHFQRLATLIEEKGYDGVAIDYENLRDDQTEAFTDYIQRLSAELHANNKKLVVTTLVDRDGHVWSGIDAAAISSAVDRLELQTFGEHGSNSEPGPEASMGWVDDMITNAITEGVPAEKIVFGVAYTGNDWLRSDTTEHEGASTQATLAKLRAINAQAQWDHESQSSFYEYEDEAGQEHIVWIEDVLSTKAKMERFRPYGVGGIFLWFIGGEDPRIWDTEDGIS